MFHSRHFDWAVSCNMQFMSSLEKGRHKASRVGLIPGTEERRGFFNGSCLREKSIAESPLCNFSAAVKLIQLHSSRLSTLGVSIWDI